MNYTVKQIEVNDKYFLFIKELVNYVALPHRVMDVDDCVFSTNELLSFIEKYSIGDFEKFKRLIGHYELNHVELNSMSANPIYPMYTLAIHPSRKCNLRCRYCFANDNVNLPFNEISIDTAKKAVDFLVFNLGTGARKFTIDIAGSGEPLLRFDFIKELSEYCKNIHYKTGKEIKIMFPSNGTLMTEEIADYLENGKNILLGFSIDGNKLQNSNRIKFNEEPAFDDAAKGIDMIKNRKYGIAVTITHTNEKVDEIYDYLIKRFKNVDAISMQVVRDYGKSETSFYKINLTNLINHYKKLVDNILIEFDKKNYEYIKPLLVGADYFGSYFLRVLGKGRQNRYRCSAGRSTIAVDDVGKLYSCSVGNGDENYEIGDIYSGIDINKVKTFSYPTTEYNPNCKKCWASYICGGECFVTAKLSRNDFYLSNKAVCSYRKSLIELSVYFLQELIDNYPDAYKYVFNVAKERSFFESVVDSSSWAIGLYFKSKNIEFDYNTIENQLGSNPYGVPPKIIVSLCKGFQQDFDFYQIETVESLKKINNTAIVLLNKMDPMYYEYAFIKDIGKDSVELITNFHSTPIRIGFEEFIQRCSDIIAFG